MLKMINKLLFGKGNQNAQHISEYSLLVVSIMAGVLITGPYVIRSWNAYLKSHETDIRDSFTDPLLQAPPDDQLRCDCGPWESGECGVTFGDTTCAPLERLQFRSCIPFGCTDAATCSTDETCCEWQDNGCGLGECTNPLDMQQIRDCGDGLEERCIQAHPMCSRCETGPLLPTFQPYFPWKENLCPGDIQFNPTDQPEPFYRVPDGGCTDSTKCEVECNSANRYIPSANGFACECEPGYFERCYGLGTGRTCECVQCEPEYIVWQKCLCTNQGECKREECEGNVGSSQHLYRIVAACPPGKVMVGAQCVWAQHCNTSEEIWKHPGHLVDQGLATPQDLFDNGFTTNEGYFCEGWASSHGDTTGHSITLNTVLECVEPACAVGLPPVEPPLDRTLFDVCTYPYDNDSDHPDCWFADPGRCGRDKYHFGIDFGY